MRGEDGGEARALHRLAIGGEGDGAVIRVGADEAGGKRKSSTFLMKAKC